MRDPEAHRHIRVRSIILIDCTVSDVRIATRDTPTRSEYIRLSMRLGAYYPTFYDVPCI